MQLLSEEIFDFSRGEMTQQKIKELKGSLNRYIFASPFFPSFHPLVDRLLICLMHCILFWWHISSCLYGCDLNFISES